MKGLLLKDWYIVKKDCRSYIFIGAAFVMLSLASNNNMFFVFYPCLLCGMIPITLLGYDERSRWIQYSGTLPYTKTQIVSAKYLVGLLAQAALLTVTMLLQGIKMTVVGNFVFGELAVMILLMLIVSTVTSSIALPFIFKLGVEKGRTAYYVMIGFVCVASGLASGLMRMELQPNLVLTILAFTGIGIYVFSWYMSIVFYKKREIQ